MGKDRHSISYFLYLNIFHFFVFADFRLPWEYLLILGYFSKRIVELFLAATLMELLSFRENSSAFENVCNNVRCSNIHLKHIAIAPGTLLSHFGIIKPP